MTRRVIAMLTVVAAFGVAAGTAAADTKQPPPKVQHSDFSFPHYVDKASAVLF